MRNAFLEAVQARLLREHDEAMAAVRRLDGQERGVAQRGRTREECFAPQHDAALREEALRRCRDGQPTGAVAREMGIAPSAVRRWRKAAGIPSCRPGGRR